MSEPPVQPRNYWLENLRRTVHHWDDRETEIGLVVIVITALGYGVVTQNPLVLKWSALTAFVYVALLLLVIVPKAMWDDSQARIVAYEEKLRPILAFVHEPNRAPFLQISRLRETAKHDRIVRMCRVGIRNDSSAIINRVRVVIESATYFHDGQPVPESPEQPAILEHALNIMGRDKKSGYVSVAPGDRPTAYVDVVQQITSVTETTSAWMTPCYATGHQTLMNARAKWVLCLRVEGGGAYCRTNVVITGSEERKDIAMRLAPA